MQTHFMHKTPHHRTRTGVGAGVRLKQRLTQLLVPSFCSTNATKIATTSATAFVSHDNANANANPHQEPRNSPDFCTRCTCTYQRPNLEEGSGLGRHRHRSASVVHDSIDYTYTGGGFGRHSVHSDVPLLSPSLPTNDAKKHSNKSRGVPRSPSVSTWHRSYSSCRRVRRPRRSSVLYSCSSSTVTDDESGEDAETRTLFSSLRISSDSTTEFYHVNRSNASRKNHSNGPRRAPRQALPRTRDPPDAFQQRVTFATKHQQGKKIKREEDAIKKMGVEETGVVGMGMAVVKQSSNPYADFRSSMVEMVVERRMGSVGKMEELLASYLSLNSPEHHPAIIDAFEDVWETVLGEA